MTAPNPYHPPHSAPDGNPGGDPDGGPVARKSVSFLRGGAALFLGMMMGSLVATGLDLGALAMPRSSVSPSPTSSPRATF